MYRASFGKYEIEIMEEVDYTIGSADNKFVYELVYQHPEDIEYRPTSIYGIRVYKDGIF